MVNINEMQFSFVAGRDTNDAIFVVCQLQEKYTAANKLIYFAFIDEVFDHVPRKSYLRLKDHWVEEWAVLVIQGMYSNAQRHVRVSGQDSEEFGMGIGVHQSSVLSQLLFILVLETFV